MKSKLFGLYDEMLVGYVQGASITYDTPEGYREDVLNWGIWVAEMSQGDTEPAEIPNNYEEALTVLNEYDYTIFPIKQEFEHIIQSSENIRVSDLEMEVKMNILQGRILNGINSI